MFIAVKLRRKASVGFLPEHIKIFKKQKTAFDENAVFCLPSTHASQHWSRLVQLPFALGAPAATCGLAVRLGPVLLELFPVLGTRAGAGRGLLRRVLLVPLRVLAGVSHAVLEVVGNRRLAVRTSALVATVGAVEPTVRRNLDTAPLAGLGGELRTVRTVGVPHRNGPAASTPAGMDAVVAQPGAVAQWQPVGALRAGIRVLPVAALLGGRSHDLRRRNHGGFHHGRRHLVELYLLGQRVGVGRLRGVRLGGGDGHLVVDGAGEDLAEDVDQGIGETSEHGTLLVELDVLRRSARVGPHTSWRDGTLFISAGCHVRRRKQAYRDNRTDHLVVKLYRTRKPRPYIWRLFRRK